MNASATTIEPTTDPTDPATDPATGSTASGQHTDRRGLRVLPAETCLDRLRATPVGRLLFSSAGDLVVLPVNHAVDGSSVVFRTSYGSKLEVAARSGSVAYEVDAYDPAAGSGWSVVVKGVAEVVHDDADVARYDALGLRSWADPASEGVWVRVRAHEISGREIRR